MERRVFHTPHGEVWVWGAADAFDGLRPKVLAIAGAFAIERPGLSRLQELLPEAGCLFAHTPSFHSPALPVSTPQAMAAAYAGAVGPLAVAVGESAGALIALGLPAAARVLIEPPLVTGKLWPLRETWAGQDNPVVRETFGYPGEGRDHRALLDGLSGPTWVLMGDDLLGAPRPLERIPSLVDEPERALLRAHPWVGTVTVTGAGHALLPRSGGALPELIRRGLTHAAALG